MMQQFADFQRIRRYGRLGQILMYAGLGATLLAAVIAFLQPAYILIALLLMLLGAPVSQIGTVLYNRYGRSPRVDEVLYESLKGLDERYGLFHYLLGTSHALIGPSGAFALIPRFEEGILRWEGGVWSQELPPRRLRLGSGRKRLRRLDAKACQEAEALQGALDRLLGGNHDLEAKPLVIFLSNRSRLEAEEAPYPAAHRKKLKETIRRLPRAKSLSPDEIRQLGERLQRL